MSTTTERTVAFVTLVTTDSYAAGALALAHALRARSSNPQSFDLVALATPTSLSAATQHALRAAFDQAIGVEPLGLRSLAAVAAASRSQPSGLAAQEASNLVALDRPDLAAENGAPLTKVHIWRLTQYAQVVYLDADVLPLRSLDHLLYRTLPPRTVAAAPDAGWPDTFNSGLLVVHPSESTFLSMATFASRHPSWDGADQGLLNDFIASEGSWDRLSFLYNATPSGGYMFAPAWSRYATEVFAVHFIGAHKPWDELAPVRPASSDKVDAPLPSVKAGDWSSLAYVWWHTYAAARPDPDPLGLGYTAKGQSSPWGQSTPFQSNYTQLPLPGKNTILPTYVTQPAPEQRPTTGSHSTLSTLSAPSSQVGSVGSGRKASQAANWDASIHPPPALGTQAPPVLAQRSHNAWNDFNADRKHARDHARHLASAEHEHRTKQREVLEHLAHTQGYENWGGYLPSSSTTTQPESSTVSTEAPVPAQEVQVKQEAKPTPTPTRVFAEDALSLVDTARTKPELARADQQPKGLPTKIKYTNAWDRIPSIAKLGGVRTASPSTSSTTSTNSSRQAAIRQRVAEANSSDATERAEAHARATGPPTREAD